MRVLVFGDSVAYGGSDNQGGWVDRIKAEYSTSNNRPAVYNLGVSGDTSDNLLKRMESEIIARVWEGMETAIIVAIGINDSKIKGGEVFSSSDSFRTNLNLLYEIAKQHAKKILFVGLNPCVDSLTYPTWLEFDAGWQNSRIKAFNELIREFCSENGIEFVDIYNLFGQQELGLVKLFPDGLHPHGAACRDIANAVKPHIDKWVEDVQ